VLVAMNRWLFGVPFKGSALTLAFGGLLYVLATTSMGLLISAFTRTQIAAILGTMIITSLPTIQFSGLIVPRSSLEGAAAVMGSCFRRALPRYRRRHLHQGAGPAPAVAAMPGAVRVLRRVHRAEPDHAEKQEA
jgi:hypothetical protein